MSADRLITIAFAGGGTGGHLYPALAVADELREQVPGVRFLFFVTTRTIDSAILDPGPDPAGGTPAVASPRRRDCELVRQPILPLKRHPLQWPAFVASYRSSVRLCRDHLTRAQPIVVVGSGGFASIPAIRSARRLCIPTVLLNPDAVPGKANRWLGGRANRIFAQWEATRRFFAGHDGLRVMGCPVRSAFCQPDRGAGLISFRLDGHRKTLLVTGASQGARTVNEAMIEAMPNLLSEYSDWQVLHLTGHQDLERTVAAYRDTLSDTDQSESHGLVRFADGRLIVAAYTDQMASALAVADVVVSRAGASTLAELTAVGRASVLMPYPFHRDQHQFANARVLVDAGAGVLLSDAIDARLNAEGLKRVLGPLLRDDASRVRMATAARRLGRTDAAARIAAEIVELTAAVAC